MIGIYKITSPSKKVYIGQSTDINKRMKKYRINGCIKQRKLYNSLKKYGFDRHKFEILEICSVEELNEKERYYQDLYCVLNKSGLNLKLTTASDRYCIHSEETKKEFQSLIKEENYLQNYVRKCQLKGLEKRIIFIKNNIQLIQGNE